MFTATTSLEGGHRIRRRSCCVESLEPRVVLARLFDLDSDGDLDVLHNLAWYENYDGYGNFVAHEISAERTEFSLAADLDGDGDLDIITSQPKWYENDGNRQFVTEHGFPGDARRFTELKLFDVGGDDDIDIIGLQHNTAHLFENLDGNGTFAEAAVYDLPQDWRDVGDFDLDGRLDILVFERVDYRRALANDPTPRELHISVFWLDRDLGNGAFERQRLWAETVHAFQFPAERPGTPEWNYFLDSIREYYDQTRGGELADVNGDGLLDLVRRETSSDDPNYRPVIWHENVNGSIAEMGSYVGDEGHGDLWLQDIDHDGDLDSLYRDNMEMALVWSINSAGSFEPGGQYATWIDQSVLDLGDINGNGLFNALVRIEGGIPIWLHAITDEEHVNGEVPEPSPISTTVFVPLELRVTSGRMLQFADLDNDGRRDVLVFNYQGSNDAFWLADRDGDRTYESATQIEDSRSLNNNARVTVDFDLDGDIDFICIESMAFNRGYIMFYENTDGLGTFERHQIGGIVPSFPVQLRVQDIDRDGDQDIVTLNEQRDFDGLRVHLNAGGRTFESQWVDSALPSDLPPIVLADLDRDGDDDLVASTGSAVVWYENEQGRLAGRRTLLTSGGSVQVVDMDADDDLEMVISDGEAIRFFDNQVGTYVLTRELVHHRSGTLGAEDMDGDGDTDIFVHGRHTIEWFENRNEQFIGPLVIELTQNFYGDIEFVDWDTDGDLDVVRRNGLNWALLENRQVGDVNNDRLFDSQDLMALFALGQYEDETDDNSTFATGDWNGDGDFSSADLVLAFQLGHYASSPPLAIRAAAAESVFAEQEGEATSRLRSSPSRSRSTADASPRLKSVPG